MLCCRWKPSYIELQKFCIVIFAQLLIRNKVAHNNLFSLKDLNRANELHQDVLNIIHEAEDKIDEFTFSTQEQESIRRSSNDLLIIEDMSNAVIGGDIVVTNINKSTQDEVNSENNASKDITEEIFMDELDNAQHWVDTNPVMNYIGLKWFVFKLLVPSGYDYSSSYALANILQQKGTVEIYEIKNEDDNYTVKAIKKSKNI